MSNSYADSLLIWLQSFKSFSSSIHTLTDISYGTILSYILNEVDPQYFNLSPSSNSDNETQKDNLISLVDSMENYFINVLHKSCTLQFDYNKIINKDLHECEELCSWILILVCFCRNNNQYLDVITTLPSETSEQLKNIVSHLSPMISDKDEDSLMNNDNYDNNNTNSIQDAFRKEMTQMEENNDRLKKDKLLLTSQNEELNSQVLQCQETINLLQKKLEGYQDVDAQLDDYKKKLSNASICMDDMQHQMEQDKRDYDSKLMSLNNELSNKNIEIEANKTILEEQNQQLASAKKNEKKIHDLELRLEEYKPYKSRCKQLEEQNNQYLQELAVLRERSKDSSYYTDAIQQLNIEINKISLEKTDIQTDLETMTATYTSLKDQYDSLYKSYKELEIKSTAHQMNEDINASSSLRLSLQSSDGQYINYDQRTEKEMELNNQIIQLEAQNKVLREQLEQGGSAQQQLSASAALSFQETRRQLEAKITELKLDATRYQQIAEEQKKEINAITQELSLKEKMNSQLNTQLNTQQTTIQQLQQSLSTTQQAQNQREREIKTLLESKEEEKTQLSNYLKSELQKAKNENKDMDNQKIAISKNLQFYIDKVKFLQAHKSISNREQEKMMSCIYSMGNHILNNQYLLSQNTSRSADWMNKSTSMSNKAIGLQNALDKEKTSNDSQK